MASYQYVYHMDGVSKAYPGGKKVFENIRLNFLPGVKIGVVGVNGAGKSTLLKVMAGIDKDFQGEAWAAKGAKVAIFDRNQEQGEKVASEIGGVFCECDVTSDEKVAAAFEQARAAHGQERVLVNCAGVANAVKTVGRDRETKEVKKYPLHQFELVIGINLIGTFRCIAHSAAGMVDAEPGEDGEKGVIINTASVSGVYGNVGQTNYAAAKAGVIGMTKTWAKELGTKGITVNAVAPGFIETEMTAKVPEKVLAKIRERIPLRRLGKPEDVANVYVFLASDASDYLNGAVLHVDGGIAL